MNRLDQAVVLLGLLVGLGISGFSGNASAGDGGGSSVGNGGDPIADEFVGAGKDVFAEFQKEIRAGLSVGLGASELATIEGLLVGQDHATVVSESRLFLEKKGGDWVKTDEKEFIRLSRKKDAATSVREVAGINYPTEKRIEVSRAFWASMTSIQRCRLALHEFSGLLKKDLDYSISNAWETQTVGTRLIPQGFSSSGSGSAEVSSELMKGYISELHMNLSGAEVWLPWKEFRKIPESDSHFMLDLLARAEVNFQVDRVAEEDVYSADLMLFSEDLRQDEPQFARADHFVRLGMKGRKIQSTSGQCLVFQSDRISEAEFHSVYSRAASRVRSLQTGILRAYYYPESKRLVIERLLCEVGDSDSCARFSYRDSAGRSVDWILYQL